MPPGLGTDKARTIFLKHESHKLHQEFEASDDIEVGQPVKLHTDGTIRAYTAADNGTTPIVGYALHKAVSGQLVTVVAKAHLVLYVVSNAAIASTGMGRYDSLFTGTSGEKYNKVQTATIANYEGWILDTASAADKVVRYLAL